MDPTPPEISVSKPVDRAIERVKQMLFRPFSIEKWITIGFCAWLANLGQGGGSFNFNNGFSGGKSTPSTNFNTVHAHDFVMSNLSWIIPLGVVIVIIFIALVVVIIWLHSRGTFMFLHCVALDRAEVKVPWRKYAREGWSFFKFNLMLAFAGLALLVPIILGGAWIIYDMVRQNGANFDASKVVLLVALILAWFCIWVPLMIINVFTRHFVAPITYMRGCTCVEGWRILIPLLEGNAGRFTLYILFQIVLSMGIGFLVIAFVLGTCCIGGILLIIPFIGAVVRLPVSVFQRSYPLYYLAQYGEEYNVFRSVVAPPPLT